jgi:hypothetical protein
VRGGRRGHHAQGLPCRPRVQLWLGQTRPPELIDVAQHPVGERGGQPDQPSAGLFFRS